MIVVMAVTGALAALFALIGAISWLTMARITRGQCRAAPPEFAAQRARRRRAGSGRHILPNAAGPVIVYATPGAAAGHVDEAFLSFLGLGVQAPLASWGTLVTEGSSQIVVYPWLLIFPGAAMAIAILSLNFVGDGVRDAVDPRSGQSSR